MGEGRVRNENHLKPHTLSGKTTQAEGLQNDNGKVPLHAHSASTGVPNLTVEQEIQNPVGPLQGPARLRWGSGPPVSLRVWVREESPLAPFSLPARHGSSHRPWLRRVPALERPQVPSGPSLLEAKRRTSQPLLASRSERIFCAWRKPWARALATPAACEGDAQGRGRVAAAPRRRRKARRGHSHGRRRVSGGSAGSGGEGLPRPAEAPGSRPPEAPVRAGADPRQPLRPPSKDCPSQFQPHTRAWLWRGQSPRLSVRLCVFQLHILSSLRG